VASVWLGLTASYALPAMPPSFAILAVATGSYVLAAGLGWLRDRQSPAAVPGT
jgi:zinc/manganese transport system permease protein